MNATKRKPKGLRRKLWSLLRLMPAFLRAKILRARFSVPRQLPSEFVFKQAETAEEIQQALKLVHDSYVELDYMDPNEAQMRFSKFHALPTTVILIAQWKDEVIGTVSIIPDSFLGLPSDATWALDKYRKNGEIIAEISSLSIKRNFRRRRGRILMPLCKLMNHYCIDFLKLDGIVIATTMEVEPFYTDILQFERVTEETGQEHSLVKGNPSACCFLNYKADVKARYKKVYAGKPKERDLHDFFFEFVLANVQLPKPKLCIQAYVLSKNLGLSQLLRKHATLSADFSLLDQQIIQNLDIGRQVSRWTNRHLRNIQTPSLREPRAEVRAAGRCSMSSRSESIRCRVMDISRSGFRIHLEAKDLAVRVGETLWLSCDFQGQVIECKATIQWIEGEVKVGCSVVPTALSAHLRAVSPALARWHEMVASTLAELGEEPLQRENLGDGLTLSKAS